MAPRKKKKENLVTMGVVLTQELHAMLTTIADEEQRSISSLIRLLLERQIKRHKKAAAEGKSVFSFS